LREKGIKTNNFMNVLKAQRMKDGKVKELPGSLVGMIRNGWSNSPESAFYWSRVPHFPQTRLLMLLPRLLLHDGHFQLTAVNPQKAAIATTCIPNSVPFDNSTNSGRL
jgi:hypothetical protein